jgi:hypothetical protein
MKVVSLRIVAGLGAAALLSAGCAEAGATLAAAGHGTSGGTVSEPCRPRQLGFAYVGSEAGAGNDFGSIVVWDKSGTACALTGPVRVTGLDRAGHRVTERQSLGVSGTLVLVAHGTGPLWSDRRGTYYRRHDTVAVIALAAEYRDDPAGSDGLCTGHQVEAATWRVTLASGAVRLVANSYQHGPDVRTLPANHGLLTCRGELDRASPITIVR